MTLSRPAVLFRCIVSLFQSRLYIYLLQSQYNNSIEKNSSDKIKKKDSNRADNLTSNLKYFNTFIIAEWKKKLTKSERLDNHKQRIVFFYLRKIKNNPRKFSILCRRSFHSSREKILKSVPEEKIVPDKKTAKLCPRKKSLPKKKMQTCAQKKLKKYPRKTPFQNI